MFLQLLKKYSAVFLVSAFSFITFVGCGQEVIKFNYPDISGTPYTGQWQLTDTNGKPSKLGDFNDKVVVVFFGFTRCPGPCPTAMGEWSAVMRKLGEKASQVQLLFITIDPEFDTPKNLERYVTNFDKRFIGLYGTQEQLKQAAMSFQAKYQKESMGSNGEYTMAHSSASYVFDKKGKIRLLVEHGAENGIDKLVQDVQHLLK